MKDQKGITLISLTIYIISLTFIIAILATVTTFFYKNVKDTQNDIEPLTEFTSFNSYFSQDINNSNIKLQDIGEKTIEGQNNEYEYITLNNVNLENEDSMKYIKYIYVENDKSIYRDIGKDEDENRATMKICRGVENCKFSQELIENNKIKVNIEITIGDKNQTYSYTLNN